MRPAFLDAMSWEMAEVYGAITDQLLINLARYFPYYNAGDPLPTSAFEYQAAMLAQMGQVNAESMRIIRNGLADADDALNGVLETAVADSVRKVEPDLYRAAKAGVFMMPSTPILSPNQTRAFQLYYKQAADKLNLVNTVMLESTQSAYTQAVSDVVSEMAVAEGIGRIQTAMDTAAGEAITGVSSWNQAKAHAIDRMKENGITGFIDHAGRHWSAEAYVAMDVRTTVMNTARAAVWETNESFGNDLYSVSWHNGARPLCYDWQNKVISSIDAARTVVDLDGNEIQVYAQSATTYGQPAGLFGINCGHYPTPFIPGVSKLRGQPQNEEDNAKTYAESQQQRGLERKLREEKRDLMMLKEQGAPDDIIAAQRDRCRQTSADIDQFCKETGRARHRDREGVYTKREFPEKDSYDISQFDRTQKDIIEKYYKDGGAQQEFTFGQMTPNVPLVPNPPPVVPGNVAQQATQSETPAVQSKAAKSVSDAKDFDEMKTYMKDSYGIDMTPGVEKLDFDAVQQTLTGFERVTKDFPEVGSNILKIDTSKSGVMSCNGSAITFNPKYYTDKTAIEKALRDCTESGWWCKGSNVASIGAHETGHAVEHLLIELNKTYQYSWERVDAWNSSTEAKSIVHEAMQNIKKTPWGKGKVKKDLIASISGYAASDASETMAEAFGDIIANGTNASPFSQEIYRVTQQRYRMYKGVSP